MVLDELYIVLEKLAELKKYLPNDDYINQLYKNTLDEKNVIEKQTFDVKLSNHDLALCFYVITRKISDRVIDVVLKDNWKELWIKPYDLFCRKTVLKREIGNRFDANHLQSEARDLINLLIWENFLNQVQNLIETKEK